MRSGLKKTVEGEKWEWRVLLGHGDEHGALTCGLLFLGMYRLHFVITTLIIL